MLENSFLSWSEVANQQIGRLTRTNSSLDLADSRGKKNHRCSKKSEEFPKRLTKRLQTFPLERYEAFVPLCFFFFCYDKITPGERIHLLWDAPVSSHTSHSMLPQKRQKKNSVCNETPLVTLHFPPKTSKRAHVFCADTRLGGLCLGFPHYVIQCNTCFYCPVSPSNTSRADSYFPRSAFVLRGPWGEWQQNHYNSAMCVSV